MEEILSRDREMKERLAEVYSEIERFDREKLADDIRNVLSEQFGNYLHKIMTFKSELVNDECPIVVAGKNERV